MTVWLLFTGTQYDDYGVSQVYASEEEALKGAQERMEADHEPDYGEWERMPSTKPVEGVICSRHMWFRGNDRLWLTPYPVHGTAPAETVSSGWAFRTESGEYMHSIIDDEGDVIGHEAVPLSRATWVSHDTFLDTMSRRSLSLGEAEKALGRLTAVPIKVTVRREVVDGTDEGSGNQA